MSFQDIARMGNLFDFSHFPTLESERLHLREMSPQDVTTILKHFGNPEVVKFIDMKPITTIEQADEWLSWMGGFFAARDGLRWGVVIRDEGTLIGSAGLHNWNREAHCAELGYDIAYPYWGHGYSNEVARALIEFGWERMSLNRIEVDVIGGNVRSKNMLESIGFKREGVLRQRVRKDGKYFDVYVYGLLRTEYSTRSR